MPAPASARAPRRRTRTALALPAAAQDVSADGAGQSAEALVARNVPDSIATDKLVPQGTSALAAKGFEIVAGYNPDARVYSTTARNLRRVALSALGLVKYIFPDQHAVYLHDTPADQLFGDADRGFSHGCIRRGPPSSAPGCSAAGLGRGARPRGNDYRRAERG